VNADEIDAGMGIAPDQQRDLFERFQRRAPLRHFGGFGLGLWIVRQIVEAHGGTVAVTSRAGEGARFAFTLPRSRAKAA
jgi:signal transduction histidine kinase